MNATERDQLQQFLSALRQTCADPKDSTADALIREALRAQADAPYLLVQRAMALGLALEAAHSRMAQLEAQCAQQLAQLAQRPTSQTTTGSGPSTNGSWMSGAQAWGRGTDAPAAHSPAPAPTRLASSPSAAPPAAMPTPAPASAWGGGMMAQMATTAAGVVAGGLLFQGVQSLMGHPKPSSESNAASPSHSTPDEALPGLVSPQASADNAGDGSWDAGEDWA